MKVRNLKTLDCPQSTAGLNNLKKGRINIESAEISRASGIWRQMLEAREKAGVSLERARLLTASWKETEGLPVPIRRARAFEKIVTGIPI